MEPALGEDIIDVEMDEAKRQQMRNVIVITVIVTFLCLLAVIISCIQKHTNQVSDTMRGDNGPQIYRKMDEQNNSNSVKHNIGQMLAKGVSRKYLFHGNPKHLVSPSKKYEAHATPIFEDSQEQYATNAMSQS